ncbi:hypothetical protein Ahy_A10g048713 [Arachis hypogaea]|uniref:Uncharacterized protein n=1 Tax=Arachis hypogaea TaxID=3818 RepID=A0A445B5V3_ARAHY|nr:hypothetical protein Ahy_A10g048713 [Arachis hypogaea]
MYTHLKSNHNEPLLEARSRSLMIWCIEELTVILHRTYDTAMTEMQEYKAKSNEKCLLSYKDASLEDINELQSPPHKGLDIAADDFKNQLSPAIS